MAVLDVMAPLDVKENEANLGLLAHKESEESRASRGCTGGPDRLGKKDCLEKTAQLELKGHQESEESKAFRDCMDIQGHLGKKGLLAHKEREESKALRGYMDIQGHLGKTGQMENEARQDRQDHTAARGGEGLEVDRVRGVDQGKEDGRVREDHRGRLVHRAGIAVTLRRGPFIVAILSQATTLSHAVGVQAADVQGTTT